MAINTEHSLIISKMAFKIIIGTFFGFAITSIIGRLSYRIYFRRNLFLDYVVLIGTICLCATVGIVYKTCEFFFLLNAIQRNSSLLSQASADQVRVFFETRDEIFEVSLVFTWTTIFAVKFSFLIFFKKLINPVSHIHIYYWIVGIITFLSWLFTVLEPLVLCREPNKSFVKCGNSFQFQTLAAMSWLTNSLDIFTDILVVSIPLIILRRAKIKKRQKFALSFFLCLSTVMIVIAIVRVSRLSHPGGMDVVWQTFWQVLEPCIALLMTSITAFRSIFVSQEMRKRNQKRWAAPPSFWKQRAKPKNASEEDGNLCNSARKQNQQLPSIPQATFVRLTKFIQHSGATERSIILDLEETDFLEERERERDREDESSFTLKTSKHQDQSIC